MGQDKISQMNGVQIHTFLVASEEMGFAKAAKKLNVTQSAVSKNVEKLEAILDIKLFYRTTKGIALTEAGKYLNENIKNVLINITNIYKEAKRIDEEDQQVIHIAIMDTIDMEEEIHARIAQFKRRQPKINVNLEIETMSKMFHALEEGRYDIVLVPSFMGYQCGHDYSYKWVVKDKAIVLMSSASPLAQKAELTFEDIKDEVFVKANTPYTNDYVSELFQKHNQIPQTVSPYNNYFSYANLYQGNEGLLIVDKCFQLRKNSSIVSKKLSDFNNGIIAISKRNVRNKNAILFMDSLDGEHT